MAIFLLKKSYQLKDLKEIQFKNLWGDHGIFTTMWIFGKPIKILFFKSHIKNLIKSLNKYKIKKKYIYRDIIKIINKNLSKKIRYNHLLRVALNKKIISISLRKRLSPKMNFSLKLVNLKRDRPKYKNLKYKKILSYLSKMDTSKSDIVLVYKNKILETGTSNLLFIKGEKIFSPKRDYYEGNTYKFFRLKIKKIIKKDIFIKELGRYDEIILIGSGKGVVSVNRIEKTDWKRKSLKNYRILSKIYAKALKNCPRYNG